MSKVCEFYVEGMHCAACELLVESDLAEHKQVKNVKASLNNQKVTVTIDSDNSTEDIRTELNTLVKKAGYTLHTAQPISHKIDYIE
ncbi:heavy-metal-associated domain-containing protein, partial [Patescibacteria group bacterium]|nr:heavy-metal-associated domain-containing protein [Patescibacteria group bacterium]